MYFFIFVVLLLYSFADAVDPLDPYDLSFLKKGAAIGDSYVYLTSNFGKMTS